MNVIPNNAIDEHLVYEALRELGFEPRGKTASIFWYFKRKIIYNQPITTRVVFLCPPLLKNLKLLKNSRYG
jgi:hypothetical protein